MISINIICCGKIKEKYWRDAIDEYSKRLQKFAKFTLLPSDFSFSSLSSFISFILNLIKL